MRLLTRSQARCRLAARRSASVANDVEKTTSSGEWPAGYPEADHTAYDLATIKRWEQVFFKRFFANQFKRSALPNGPKVVSGGTMSPRGDWRMPSDASAKAWLDELEHNVPRD